VPAPTLAVTGSTGALGGLVARDLASRGVSQRLLVRSPERAPVLDGAEVAACSYGDGEASRSALTGVETLLMVSAAENAERLREHRTFVDAAADAGVRHVVYTSFAGAAPDCAFTLGRDHWATEEHIRARGLTHTFLRDNFYLDFLPLMTGDDDVIRGPAGDGRMAGVARADVARSAVAVLLDPAAHADTTYTMTGPEALTLTEAAVILSEATGRPVTFHDETLEEAYESRRRWEAPQWQYDAWVSTYTAIAAGEVAEVSDDVRRLTGRQPLALRDLLRAT
jgi:NAD(P)H dehydrogenase (quinone)